MRFYLAGLLIAGSFFSARVFASFVPNVTTAHDMPTVNKTDDGLGYDRSVKLRSLLLAGTSLLRERNIDPDGAIWYVSILLRGFYPFPRPFELHLVHIFVHQEDDPHTWQTHTEPDTRVWTEPVQEPYPQPRHSLSGYPSWDILDIRIELEEAIARFERAVPNQAWTHLRLILPPDRNEPFYDFTNVLRNFRGPPNVVKVGKVGAISGIVERGDGVQSIANATFAGITEYY